MGVGTIDLCNQDPGGPGLLFPVSFLTVPGAGTDGEQGEAESRDCFPTRNTFVVVLEGEINSGIRGKNDTLVLIFGCDPFTSLFRLPPPSLTCFVAIVLTGFLL